MSSSHVYPGRMPRNYGPFASLNNGGDSDAQITCGDHVWSVHRMMICSAATYFRAVVKWNDEKKAEDNIVDLSDEDSDMVRRMIVFMYAGDYQPTSQSECGYIRVLNLASLAPPSRPNWSKFDQPGVPSHFASCACRIPTEIDPSAGIDTTYGPVHHCLYPLSTHAIMFYLGDKYGVDGLCELAAEKFGSCLREEHLGDEVGGEDFVSAVQIAYTETPDSRRELRDLVAECFQTHFLCDHAEYLQMEDTLPSFSAESLASLRADRDAKLAAEVSA